MHTIEPGYMFPNPDQPRKHFDPEALRELADSIKEHGLVQPIAVTYLDAEMAWKKMGELPLDIRQYVNSNARYMIVAGERRWRALCLLFNDDDGPVQVPIEALGDNLDDQTIFELAFAENLNRADMLPLEEASAFSKLRERYSVSEITRKYGRSPDFVRGRLALLDLDPDIQALVNGNHIPLTVAVSISRLSSDKQHRVVQLMNEDSLNAMQACFLSDQLYAEQEQGQLFDLGAYMRELAAEEAAKWLAKAQTTTEKVKDALGTAIQQLSLPDLEAHAKRVEERIKDLLHPKPGEFAACANCLYGGSCNRDDEGVVLDGESCFTPAPGQFPECAECRQRREDGGCELLQMLLDDPLVEGMADAISLMGPPDNCFRPYVPTLTELVEFEVEKEKDLDYLIGHLQGKTITDQVKVFVTKVPTCHEALEEIGAKPEKDHNLLVVVKRAEAILLTLSVGEQVEGTADIYLDLDYGVGDPRWDGVTVAMEHGHHYWENEMPGGGRLLYREVEQNG